MEEFDLPVDYKGQEFTFRTSLLISGYTHKFQIDVNGQEIFFEPDEERNYRAVIPYEEIGNKKNVDPELLKIIANTLQLLMT
jgi:hypothetical protein